MLQRLCSENAHKGDLRGAWLEISQAVPNRTVQSIYRHGIRKLHSFKRGPWDREEQERLIHLVGPDSSFTAKWALYPRHPPDVFRVTIATYSN